MTRARSRPSCSTRSCARTVVPPASSRSRRTAARSIQGATPTEVRRGATPPCSAQPGHLYVYFTYGMHWCANAVCGEEGEGVAVLLRAGAPIAGLEAMRAARPAARRDRDLCRGPARLCQAFGLDRAHDGADLVTTDRGVTILDDGTAPPADPVVTTRVGLSKGAEHLWRWFVAGEPHVSHARHQEVNRRRACRCRQRRRRCTR